MAMSPDPHPLNKGGDEVWVGEKIQSNPEIAGSLEIALGSLANKPDGVSTEYPGGVKPTEFQTPNACWPRCGSPYCTNKFGRSKGKSLRLH